MPGGRNLNNRSRRRDSHVVKLTPRKGVPFHEMTGRDGRPVLTHAWACYVITIRERERTVTRRGPSSGEEPPDTSNPKSESRLGFVILLHIIVFALRKKRRGVIARDTARYRKLRGERLSHLICPSVSFTACGVQSERGNEGNARYPPPPLRALAWPSAGAP